MEISITVPDDFARQIGNRWQDLPRRALEALVTTSYRERLITSFQVQQILGLRSRLETDAFLKSAGAYLDYDEQDLEADIRTLDELLDR